MIVVVGGGISGLALAHGLWRRGRSVQVLEAEQRPGGVIGTVSRDGFLAETGPNAFVDREPQTRALIDRLGLPEHLRFAEPTAKKRFVFAGGRVHEIPGSPPALIRSPLLSAAAKLRLAAELALPRGRLKDESLADFARRRFGPASVELFDALQTGTFAGDVHRLSASAAFPQLGELERAHRSIVLGMIRSRKAVRAKGSGRLGTLHGGLETLTTALARKLGPALRTNARVTGLSFSNGRWRVELGSEFLDADRLVLALPAFAAAELLRPLDAGLARELEGIEYASIAAVHLGFRRSELSDVPEGFGLIVPAQLLRPLIGCIYVSSVFPWRAPPDAVLFTCMMGGLLRPDVVQLRDDALVEAARAELGELLSIRAAPVFWHVVKWRAGIPQYHVGHLARLRRIDAALARWPGLSLTGNAYRGIGVNDCIRNADLLAESLAR